MFHHCDGAGESNPSLLFVYSETPSHRPVCCSLNLFSARSPCRSNFVCTQTHERAPTRRAAEQQLSPSTCRRLLRPPIKRLRTRDPLTSTPFTSFDSKTHWPLCLLSRREGFLLPPPSSPLLVSTHAWLRHQSAGSVGRFKPKDAATSSPRRLLHLYSAPRWRLGVNKKRERQIVR